MNKSIARTLMASAVISILALAGCDTPANSETENRYDDTGRTYQFNADGSYEFKSGDNVIDGGSYIVKENSLFLLRDYTYGSSAAVAAAVERFTFTKDDTAHTISLTSALGTTTYSLDHSGIPARTASDSLKEKKWKSGLNTNAMWNIWDFKDDGSFQYVHHHTETNTKNVGLFSYFVKDGYLVTLAPGTKNTEMGPSLEHNQVSAYSLNPLDLTFSVSPAASGGNAVYTVVHEGGALHDERAHSYEFTVDGTYKYDNNAAGNYLIRNNVLVLLPLSAYSDAEAARVAAKKYFFNVSADSTISLISDTETHVYSLSGTIPASITAPDSDTLKGKILSAKSSGASTMWNWYGFRNDGTFHFYHFMSGRADYIDRGDFTYLLQGDKLVILSAFDSNTKSPSIVPYTVAAYSVSTDSSTEDVKIAFAKTTNNPANTPATVTLRDLATNTTYESNTDGYAGFPPEHYDDGFSSGGSGSGDGDDGGHDHSH